MAIVAKRNSGTFESNPMTGGLHPAVCTEVAEREIPDFNDPTQKVRKAVARFVNAEGQEASRFYTPSLNEKATLTKDLIALGKIKANAIPDDIDVEKALLGTQVVLMIAEGVSKKDGSPTAKITAVAKAPAGQKVVPPAKKANASASPASTARRTAPLPPPVEDGTEIDDSDIPF